MPGSAHTRITPACISNSHCSVSCSTREGMPWHRMRVATKIPRVPFCTSNWHCKSVPGTQTHTPAGPWKRREHQSVVAGNVHSGIGCARAPTDERSTLVPHSVACPLACGCQAKGSPRTSDTVTASGRCASCSGECCSGWAGPETHQAVGRQAVGPAQKTGCALTKRLLSLQLRCRPCPGLWRRVHAASVELTWGRNSHLLRMSRLCRSR